MAKVDVLVVGAGPGGSSAAYFLARAGVRVLLLDKGTFPRDKTCGDGVTRRALRQLARMGLDGWLGEMGFHVPTCVRLGAPNGELAVLENPSHGDLPFGFARIVPRRKLDVALLGAATTAGAQFVPGMQATGMVTDADGAEVYATANGRATTLRCQIVVAADGTQGSFSRAVGLQRGPLLCVAVRAYLGGADRHEGFMDLLYESDILPGYGWVFPLGHGLCNVGIGVPPERARKMNLKERLQEFIATNPHVLDRLPNYEVVAAPRGAGLYAHFRPWRTYQDRLLAVGDAAGLVNPLTGSGISKALISGEIAARCACDALTGGDCSSRGLAFYGRRLWERFGKRHSQLGLLQRLFGHGRVVNRLVHLLNRDRSVRGAAGEVLEGRADYVSLLRPGALLRLLVGPAD
jgi:geranylgeranyl reductase family protein